MILLTLNPGPAFLRLRRGCLLDPAAQRASVVGRRGVEVDGKVCAVVEGKDRAHELPQRVVAEVAAHVAVREDEAKGKRSWC